jgi:uncharacterized membrane protein
MAFLQWLESTSYSDWILTSPWGWPIILSAHAIGLAIIVGVMISLNLRLLGLYGSIPYTAVHDLMNIAWVGIAINVFTGLSLFGAQATTYVTNYPFLVKISFIILGIINLVMMQKTLRREAAAWQAAGAVPQNGRMLAGTSLAFWLIAVVAGRLIAYL